MKCMLEDTDEQGWEEKEYWRRPRTAIPNMGETRSQSCFYILYVCVWLQKANISDILKRQKSVSVTHKHTSTHTHTYPYTQRHMHTGYTWYICNKCCGSAVLFVRIQDPCIRILFSLISKKLDLIFYLPHFFSLISCVIYTRQLKTKKFHVQIS